MMFLDKVNLNYDDKDDQLILHIDFQKAFDSASENFIALIKLALIGFDEDRLIVPILDTKVTKYLSSGYVFFLQTNFDFLTSHF